MTFLYTPKSGSKIITRDASTTVVTLENGSHHIIGTFCVPAGDGSRSQREKFARVASAIVQIAGGVAVDDRGALAIYTASPWLAADYLQLAGLTVDRCQLGWSLLAEGWADAVEVPTGKDGGIHLGWKKDEAGHACGLSLRAVPSHRSREDPVLACTHSADGYRWTYGEAAWHSPDVDFDVSPPPKAIRGNRAVDVGQRDWRKLAACAQISWSWRLIASKTPAEHMALAVSEWMRADGAKTRIEELRATHPGEWVIECVDGVSSVRAPDGSAHSLLASPGEREARALLLEGVITEEEAEALTGVSASIDVETGCAVGIVDGDPMRVVFEDGNMVALYWRDGAWRRYTVDGWEAE